jgi:uracil-DNA glycosylase
MFAGSPKAPILALGQNPGEIKSSDEQRRVWIETFAQADPGISGPGTAFWDFWDFIGSHGYQQLTKIFGKDWLMNKKMVWSNAVRCRTPGNATPIDEMIDACSVWTKLMIENRKAIIMVGNVAKHQVLKEKAGDLDWGIPRRHPTLGIVLAIKHYSAWKSGDAESYRKAFKEVVKKI